MINQEIEDELNELIEVSKELAVVYHSRNFDNIDEFLNESMRDDIPGIYYKVMDDILRDMVRMQIHGFECNEDKKKDIRTQLKLVWDDKEEYDNFLDNDPKSEYYDYTDVMYEFRHDADIVAKKYDPNTHLDLEKFLIEEHTCKCGNCDPNSKTSVILRDIGIFYTRLAIENRICTEEEFMQMVDKFKESQSLYHNNLSKYINLN